MDRGKTRLCALPPPLFSLYRLAYEESNRECQKRNNMNLQKIHYLHYGLLTLLTMQYSTFLR